MALTVAGSTVTAPGLFTYSAFSFSYLAPETQLTNSATSFSNTGYGERFSIPVAPTTSLGVARLME